MFFSCFAFFDKLRNTECCTSMRRGWNKRGRRVVVRRLWFKGNAGVHRWGVHGLGGMWVCVEDQACQNTVLVVVAYRSVSTAAFAHDMEISL